MNGIPFEDYTDAAQPIWWVVRAIEFSKDFETFVQKLFVNPVEAFQFYFELLLFDYPTHIVQIVEALMGSAEGTMNGIPFEDYTDAAQPIWWVVRAIEFSTPPCGRPHRAENDRLDPRRPMPSDTGRCGHDDVDHLGEQSERRPRGWSPVDGPTRRPRTALTCRAGSDPTPRRGPPPCGRPHRAENDRLDPRRPMPSDTGRCGHDDVGGQPHPRPPRRPDYATRAPHPAYIRAEFTSGDNGQPPRMAGGLRRHHPTTTALATNGPPGRSTPTRTRPPPTTVRRPTSSQAAAAPGLRDPGPPPGVHPGRIHLW